MFTGLKGPQRLVHFLQEELDIPTTAIIFAQRLLRRTAELTRSSSGHQEQNPSLLPIILWQYGFVTLEQLDQILDWLETI